jgi:Protein of unknown function (DUF1559)
MFEFPPAPLSYPLNLIARGVLLALSVLELGCLIRQVHKSKSIQSPRFGFWGGWFVLGCVVVPFAICRESVYDDNSWILPLFTAITGIAVAGTMHASLASRERQKVSVLAAAGIGFVPWAILSAIWTFSQAGCCYPRAAVHRYQCRNNLKQIGLALHNFNDNENHFPGPKVGVTDVSWRVQILPYLDQQRLHDRYVFNASWDAETNLNVSSTRVLELSCPADYHSSKDSQGRWFTSYAMLTGKRTAGSRPDGITILEITDGLSNTLLVVEACGQQIVWTEPRDVDVESLPMAINRPGHRHGESDGVVSSYHSGGAFGLLTDGSVRYLSKDIDPKVLKALTTIDAGDDVGDY